MCSYTTFAAKVDLCAHTDSKNGTFTRRVYSAYIFDSIPPPPFSAGWHGGCYPEKFFLFFSKHCFNSSSFHSVFLISFYLFSFYTRLITIWNLLHIVENNGFDMISRFYISDSKFRLVIFFYFLDSFFLA